MKENFSLLLKFRLNNLSKSEKTCEKSFDDAREVVNSVESAGKAAEEIAALTSAKDYEHFNLFLSGFVAEKRSS